MKKVLFFAGQMSEGAYDRLIEMRSDGLSEHVYNTDLTSPTKLKKVQLSILISFMDRKLLLNQTIEENLGVEKRCMEITAPS